MNHLFCSFKYGFSINLFAASIFEVVYAITHLWFKYFFANMACCKTGTGLDWTGLKKQGISL